ncbi:FG-GAP-like repeat-containing protein, partial [Segetibacter aerophilus]|uniref:FG-GAP-like repeat-containing protein n=1 Tax=Segetibacter aerophilus TaxID=670293 RepID=UPI001583F192
MSHISRNPLRPIVSFIVLFFCLLQNNSIAQTFSTKSSSTFPSPAASARVVVADFDVDGDADILYQTGADGTPFRFARSNGDGTFTDQAINISPFAGVTLVNHNGSNYHVADFDRDGDLDIWAGVNATTGSYYRNDNGTFTTQPSTTFPAPAVSSRAVIGDFDKDGDADFLYQSGGNGTAYKYSKSNGNGTFTDVPLASSPFGGVTLIDNNATNYHVADFDGDGDVDVWAGVNAAKGNYYRNDNGTFTSQSNATFPAPPATGRATVTDYDTDGDADILYQTGGNGTPFEYARSNGDGTFAIVNQAASPFASVTLADITGLNYFSADFDHDGDKDVWASKTGTTGFFYSKDAAPPNLASFTPANNSTNVSPTVNITYTFDQPVIKGTGNISIVKTSDNTIAEAIPVTGAQVTGSGTNWTIDPSITLQPSTQYAVKSDAGTFKNAGGTVFAGVSLSNVQSFRTAAATISVGVPANGTYKTGDNLTFTVNYSESMIVNTAGGAPFVPVTIGATVRNALYVSGSGTSALVFGYTVAAGDADNNGIAVGSAITLSGGTIKDASTSNNAPLTLNNIGSTTAVLVDGVAPSVASITRASANNTNATSIDYTVTFSENVSGVDITDFTLTKTGTANGTIATASTSSGTNTTITINGVTGNGTLRLDLKSSGTGIIDAVGNAISGGYTTGEVYTIVQPSNATDYFRSITSGNWNSVSTWQSSTDNLTYHAASLTPDFNANQVTILNGHTVTVTANVAIDQASVAAGGAIIVNSGAGLSINDGTGWDIVVNGNLTITNGGSMVLKSTSTGTASVGSSTGTIIGN